MASYEKLTLDRFKIALKEGKYTSLTGARRAIGKTTSWSGKERTSAQELANSHFGGAASAAPKASSKKTAKKTSAKASAKSIVTPAKKAAAKRASFQTNTGAAQHVQSTVKPGSILEHRVAAHESVGFVSHARIELQQLKTMNPKLDTVKQEQELFNILENAIGHMSHAVPSATAQATAVPRIEVPKTDPEAGVAVVAPKRITHSVSDDVAQTSGEQTVGEVQQNGTIEDADLTPAERSARDLLSTPDLGLPRPSQI